MELIVLQYSKDFNFKFLACHILNFYENHMFSIRMIPQPYHSHSASSEPVWHHIVLWTVVLQNKVYQEYTVCNCQIITCLMSSFCQAFHQTLILHLFVITNNIRCLINKLWLLPCEFSHLFYPSKIAVSGLPELNIVVLKRKKVGEPLYIYIYIYIYTYTQM